MPNFPSLTPANTTNVDNPTDLVANARVDIKQNIDNVNAINTALTGKTIVVTDETNAFSKQQYIALQTLSTDSANAYEWDLSTQQTGTLTLTANSNLNAPSNQVAGATYVLIVKQDATGGHTLTFDGTYKFPSGTAPTISTGTNAVDVLSFISDGTNLYGNSIQDVK